MIGAPLSLQRRPAICGGGTSTTSPAPLGGSPIWRRSASVSFTTSSTRESASSRIHGAAAGWSSTRSLISVFFAATVSTPAASEIFFTSHQ
ncbi:MAG: hypothetical protein IT374_00920 [Polyangiaceae bacterium]|nr:hypothetical protein [Polyangiaceae bacterium]